MTTRQRGDEMPEVRDTFIDPRAVVEKGAELDAGVRIGPFAVIGPKVRLGKGTVVHSHAVISGRTTLGAENKVFNCAVLGTDPQDLKYDGEDTELIIGEGNTFREFCTIHKGTEGGEKVTSIGDGNLFMAYCHVAHDCRILNGNVLANGTQLGGHVLIGNFNVLGGLSAVHQFCRIGDMTMIGAGSVATQDVPPYTLVQGDRAHLKGLNLVGLKRRGVSPENIGTLKKAFHTIFRSGLLLEEAIRSVEERLDRTEEVDHLIRFLSSTERGFIR